MKSDCHTVDLLLSFEDSVNTRFNAENYSISFLVERKCIFVDHEL
jgi:hypothetical protein